MPKEIIIMDLGPIGDLKRPDGLRLPSIEADVVVIEQFLGGRFGPKVVTDEDFRTIVRGIIIGELPAEGGLRKLLVNPVPEEFQTVVSNDLRQLGYKGPIRFESE